MCGGGGGGYQMISRHHRAFSKGLLDENSIKISAIPGPWVGAVVTNDKHITYR